MSSAPTSNTEWTSPLILRVSKPVYSSVPPDFETVKEWDLSSFLTSDTYYNNRLYFNNHSMNELDSLLVSIVSAGSQQSIGLQRNGWRKGRGKNAEKSWCVTCKYLRGARCTKRRNSERQPNMNCTFRILVRYDHKYGFYISIPKRKAGYHICDKEGSLHHSANSMSYREMSAEQQNMVNSLSLYGKSVVIEDPRLLCGNLQSPHFAISNLTSP